MVANLNSEKVKMKRTSLILVAVFAMVVLPVAFGQSTTAPSQDPAAQPSASPSQQTPSQTNPSTSSPSTAPSTDPSASPTSSDSQKSFVGSIVKTGGKYVLHTGGTDYELDDQSQAKKFEGKDVKVTGSLDASSNTIKVQAIDPASSM